MARIPNFDYISGADLADINLWITENGELIDLSSGNTAQVDIYDFSGTFQFTKANGIVLSAGSGTQHSGAPNVIIQWDVSGELDSLTAGSYSAFLTLFRSDGKQRKRKFTLTIGSDT